MRSRCSTLCRWQKAKPRSSWKRKSCPPPAHSPPKWPLAHLSHARRTLIASPVARLRPPSRGRGPPKPSQSLRVVGDGRAPHRSLCTPLARSLHAYRTAAHTIKAPLHVQNHVIRSQTPHALLGDPTPLRRSFRTPFARSLRTSRTPIAQPFLHSQTSCRDKATQ